jgi:hypothetical protein
MLKKGYEPGLSSRVQAHLTCLCIAHSLRPGPTAAGDSDFVWHCPLLTSSTVPQVTCLARDQQIWLCISWQAYAWGCGHLTGREGESWSTGTPGTERGSS